MELVRAFKTKLYPNKVQQSILSQIFGANRFVFNYSLGQIKEFKYGKYSKDETKPNIPSKFDLMKTLTQTKKIEEFSWLYEIPNPTLQYSMKNLSNAFDGFYIGGGYPKFKSKHNKQSFTFDHTPSIKVTDNYVILPKSKEKIRFALHKGEVGIPNEASIISYTISVDSVGEYFISFTYKITKEGNERNSHKGCGIDLGIKDILISSDGNVVENDNLLNKSQKKLTQLQRRLSKKKKGSQNRIKAKRKVAKQHRKITRQRNHRNHCISKRLVGDYDFIALESLQVKNMMKNRRLSKAISNVAWSDLVNKIQYKMAETKVKLY